MTFAFAISVVLTGLLVFLAVLMLFTPKSVEYKNWEDWGLVDDTSNAARAITAGRNEDSPIIGFIANIQGLRYDPKTETMLDIGPNDDTHAGENPFEKFVRWATGKRIYGLPFIRGLATISIDRVVRKTTVPGVKRKLAEELEAQNVKTKILKGIIYRPTYHSDYDLKDGTRFSVTSYLFLKLRRPRPAFTVYKTTLLQTVDEIVVSFLKSEILAQTWDDYKASQKKSYDDKLGELNKLLEHVGYEATGLTLSDPELNQSMQAANEAAAKAKQEALAAVVTAEGERDSKMRIADGRAYVIEKLAQARAKRYNALIELFKANNVSDKDATQMASNQVAAEFNAAAVGKLTGTYVSGNAGVQLGIPAGANK